MLHLSRIAFGIRDLDALTRRLHRAGGEPVIIETARCPVRAAELVGGSLYWIIQHRVVARSPILAVDRRDDNGARIALGHPLIPTVPLRRRAHQGWRYLQPDDAPPDLVGADEGDALPPSLLADLSALGLL